MNDQRQIFIAKVKRFARSKAGLKKIGRIAPETAAVLAEHPEYLDICQKKNDPPASPAATSTVCSVSPSTSGAAAIFTCGSVSIFTISVKTVLTTEHYTQPISPLIFLSFLTASSQTQTGN